MEGIILKECTEAQADLPPNPSRWTFAKRPDGQFFAKLYDGTILYLAGDVSAFVARLTYLENNEIKVPYFEIIDITSGTAGVLTIPAGATISLDEFKMAEDAVLSTLSGTQPSFESPLSGGTPIGVTLDGAGNWNVSGTYPSLVALIYVLKISLADFQNLNQDKYLPLDETSFQREPLIIPGTTAQYFRGDKTFQNLEPAVLATLLNGLSLATGSDVSAVDSILVAIGKLQNQAIRKNENIFSNTADVLINFNAVSALFTNFFSMVTTANDSRITDGRSMRIKGIGIFNKTAIGNSTYEVEANVAGTSMTVGAFTVGAGTIGNQIWEWELVLNFRTANQARARFTVLRRNATSELASYSVLPALITFNKTLANTITFGVRIVANGTTNNLTRTHGTAVIE